MVVFTCNHCGESLHKPKVEKHYQFQCRNYKSVTCVDCFKDFKNDEYSAHTKCITEDERYAAKGTYKNGIVKKGEVKQESWLDMIKSICDSEQNLKPSVRTLLETISGYSNVPRKKIKFMNFIKSSSGNRANMQEVEEVWNIIEQHKEKNLGNRNKNETINGEAKKRSNDDAQDSVIENKKLRTLIMENTLNEEDNTEASTEVKTKFDYKTKILEILLEKGSISCKKLEKKVLKSYITATGQNDCEEKVIKKLHKKLKKIANVSIEEDRVTLLS